MANTDINYCNGKGCVLRDTCRRYVEGQRIIRNVEGDSNQYYWFDHCSEDAREGYLKAQ